MKPPVPRWKRHQWTVARVARLVAEVQGRPLSLVQVKKRFGIGLKEMVYLNGRLAADEDVTGSMQAGLQLQFEGGKVWAAGVDRLSRLTRLSKVQAAFAAQALEHLPVQGANRDFALRLAQRLKDAAGDVPDQLLIFRPADSAAIRAKVALLDDAMRRKMTTTFEYKGPSSKKAVRTADPLSLRRDQGVWRVLCWDHERNALRTFKLENLAKLTTTTRSFSWPGHLRQEDIRAKDLSIYVPNGAEILVKMRVSAKVAEDLRPVFRKIGRPDRKGYREVRLMAANPQWLLRTFLPLADEVKVLGPESLMKLLADELEFLSAKMA